MDRKELVSKFRSLFHSRQDVYASGYEVKPGKYAYPPARDDDGNDLPITDQVILDHFSGKHIVGVYPIFDDNKVHWVALDFDGQEGEDPFKMAKKQKTAFSRNGVISYIERSRSGNGAHVWAFVDEPIEAHKIRRVVESMLVEAETYDRMFPNQDHARDGYGNLIALPYHGKSFKEGNSAFIDSNNNPIKPDRFLELVKVNKKSVIESLYSSLSDENLSLGSKPSVKRGKPREALSGALKVVSFCSWMQKARARMHKQNQEPEFYALCCQFAQLEDGERLAYEYGRLHPYDDERIAKKFEQAKEVNKPQTCKTLREEFGFECTCDIDYGVDHPYELARLSFQELIAARKGKPTSFHEAADLVIQRSKELYKSDARFGWPYGYDALDDVSEIRKGNLIVLGARTAIGKAQPLDAKILTPEGFVNMGYISKGDQVISVDGKSVEVLSVYPQGKEDVYEVVFNDGTKTECSEEHLWLTSTHYERKNKTWGSTVKTLREIKDTLRTEIGGQSRNNHQVRFCDPVKFKSIYNLPLDPYMLGIYLGDGGCSGPSVMIHTSDKPVIDYINNNLYDSDYISNIKTPNGGISYRIARKDGNREVTKFYEVLRDFGLAGQLSYTKFIPVEYLHASIEDRIRLLQGLCDSDGSPVASRGYVEYSTASLRLAEDITYLARSLGARCSYTTRMGSYTKDGEVIETVGNYRVLIRMTNGIIPFSLRRKKKKFLEALGVCGKAFINKVITDINYVGVKETQCIEIDHPDGLYITDDFIVTHNTSMSIDITDHLTSMDIPVYWASLEMTREELGLKSLSRRSEVDATSLRKGNLDFYQWRRVLEAHKENKSLPMYIDDETRDINKMMDVFASLIAEHGPGLIVVDYIELIAKQRGESMFALASRSILELKGMAKVLNVPILALSNFNRKAEQDLVDGQDPMDSWLRNSGLIEQTADVVLFLLGKRGQGTVKRELIVQKDRHSGASNEHINLWFDQSISKFITQKPELSEKSVQIKKANGEDNNLDLLR